jgi:hypothetical protein
MTAIINRLIRLILKPQQEWLRIKEENISTDDLLKKYLLIFSGIHKLVMLTILLVTNPPEEYQFISLPTLGVKIRWILFVYLLSFIEIYVFGKMMNHLFFYFTQKNDLNMILKVIIFSQMIFWAGSIFLLIPYASLFLSIVINIYSLYLLYLGSMVVLEIPGQKIKSFFIISVLILMIINITGFMISLYSFGAFKSA